MIGFEPMKDGFADRCLRPLGHIALGSDIYMRAKDTRQALFNRKRRAL